MWIRTVGAASVMAAMVAWSPDARAEGPVSPTGKGIAGGVLLGAEVPLITIGLIGIEEWWAYLLAGGVGAAGGAVGGYFVETAGTAEPSLYMLAGGMALVIPTMVVTLNATAYRPDEQFDGDEGFSDAPPDDAAPQAEPAVEGQVDIQSRRGLIPNALIGLSPSGIAVGLPPVQARPRYTASEMAMFSVEQDTELHVPVVSASF